jgi:hypothetical protein
MVNLRSKALRSWFKLKQNVCTIDDIPTEILVRLYNSVSKQINLYASEIWGPQILSMENRDVMFHIGKMATVTAQQKIAKSILDVPKKTSNIGVLAELGLYPLYIDIAINVIKFYKRLASIDQSRLVYKAFIEDCQLAPPNTKLSLAATTKSILTAAGHSPSPGTYLSELNFLTLQLYDGVYANNLKTSLKKKQQIK